MTDASIGLQIDQDEQPPVTLWVNADRDAPKEVLRIERDGRFYVKDREVETDPEVRDIFARWCRLLVPSTELLHACQELVTTWRGVHTATTEDTVSQLVDLIEAALAPHGERG